MDWVRELVEDFSLSYIERKRGKPADFLQREERSIKYFDAEAVHKSAVKAAQWVDRLHLTDLLLNHSDFRLGPSVGIRNAAGSNKDGAIPPTVLRALGFKYSSIGRR